MKKLLLLLSIACLLVAADYTGPADDLKEYPICHTCGMDRQKHQLGRMLLSYDGGSKAGTCSLRCTAVDMATHREKTITGMLVADYATGKLVDAWKASWVIGGGKTGIMSRRAKWAFEDKAAAEQFVSEHRGKLATYDEAMKAAFGDMAGDVAMPQSRKPAANAIKNDLQTHPDCKYCGMDRRKFDFSRILLVQKEAAAVGTCSIHCTALDLAVNYDKPLEALWVGDYGTRKLINARKAYWAIGGDRQGVMSLRGKWAFEMRKDAEEFVRAHGGAVGSFDVALQAAFEDMWEILR